jgi:hypothetical protein
MIWIDEAIPFIILIIIGAYVFGLLYLNAKVKPEQQRLPERLAPVRFAVNSAGVMFLMLFLLIIGVLLWYSASCLLSDCPRIE